MPNLQLLELQNPTFTPHSGDYAKYSDKKLLCLAKYYGEETLKWRQRFIGLLPEVNHRKLYLKKGYSSIVEFGKRMAGLSEAQIRLAINLEKKFEDKPMLYEALVKGKVSISKLVRVAAIATVENEELLAESAKVLSKASLDVLVGDVRLYDKKGGSPSGELRMGNGLFEPQSDPKSLPGQTFQLNPEVIEKLNALQKKGIDVNEVLKEILEKRDVEIEEQKEEIVKETAERDEKRRSEGKKPAHTARSLPCEVRWRSQPLLKEEYGTKCAVGGCDKAAEHLHHTVPFSINGSNSPDLLKPLCRAHHDIVHSVNARYLEKKGMG